MPVFVAIGEYVAGTVLGLVGTAATIVGGIVAVGAAFVTSRIINGNPNKGINSAASPGGRIQVPPATNNKIPVVYGSAYINGIITDARLISTDQKVNNTMYYCIVLSETCNNNTANYTVNNVYWNDLRLTFDSTAGYKVKDGRKTVDGPGEDFIDTNFVQNGQSLVEVRVYAGSTAAADQIFPASGTTPAYTYWAGDDGSWDATYEMKGLVFAIVKVTWNQDKGFTGLPNITFQLENSVNNPADVWYDYMSSQRYGAGINPSYIDATANTAWKNFSNEQITYINKDGTTNQLTSRYTMNGVVDTSRSVKENIDSILQSGGAWMSYNVATGLWSPVIKKAITAGEQNSTATYFTATRTGSTLTVTNFPAGRIEQGQLLYDSIGSLIGTISSQLTPTGGETAGQKGRYTTSTSGTIASTTFYTLPANILSFTDDNITSGITLSSTRLEDLYNMYEVEFYDQHNKDQKSYARKSLPDAQRNPNEPDNQIRLSLDFANNSMQADLLGNLELRQSRDDLVIEFTTNHYGIQAQAGDVIAVSSELYAWAPKYFRVMRIKEQETEDGSLVAQIQALEYNPDVYTVEDITEFTTSANIGIGIYGTDPNLPPPSAVIISSVDADVPIPNFQLNIGIPTSGGPFDEIELYYTEGWDEYNITGSIVPGTGTNGAPTGKGLLTITNCVYASINSGDYFTVGSTKITVVSQITSTPASKTFVAQGSANQTLITLNDVTGLLVGHTLTGTGLTNGAHILEIDSGTNTVRVDTGFTAQGAGTYTVTGGLGTYIVDTSTTVSGTALLYDQPLDIDYKYLKKVVPEGNTPTFVNGDTITVVVTEVPANSATYRRWYVKARLGLKKRFGRFSTPSNIDYSGGRFPYRPNPVGGGGSGPLPGSFSGINVSGTTPFITFATQPDGTNPMYGIRGKSTIDDQWFVGSGSVGDDLGYLELATADNAGESNSGGEIYVRQYNGSGIGGPPWFGGPGTVQRELVLLDNLGNTIIPQNLTVDSGTLFVNSSTNRVGINNTSPTSSLDVTGSAKISSNLNVDNGTLYVDATNNRVGVSNTSPSYDLQVGSTSGYTQFAITNYERSALFSIDTTTDKFSFNYNTANRLEFDLSNQWFNAGNTGFNTTAPQYTIDVNGTANVETTLTVPNITTLAGDNLNISAYTGKDINITTTNAADNGGLTLISNTSADPVTIVRNTANTNSSTRSLTLRVNSTATPAVGLTNTLEFETETANNVVKTAGYVAVTTTNTTTNAETFEMDFGLRNGLTYSSLMNLNQLGDLQLDRDLTVNRDVYIQGTNLVLNSDGTGTENVIIKFERGTTDSTITWREDLDSVVFSDSVGVDNQLTVKNDIIQVTPISTQWGPTGANKNIVTSTSYVQYNNSLYYDPATYHTIDAWNRSDYSSAKYILNVENTTDVTRYQIIECLVLGSQTPYITIYGDLFNDNSTIMLQVTEDTVYFPGLIQLQAYALIPAGLSGGITRITMQRTLFAKAT